MWFTVWIDIFSKCYRISYFKVSNFRVRKNFIFFRSIIKIRICVKNELIFSKKYRPCCRTGHWRARRRFRRECEQICRRYYRNDWYYLQTFNFRFVPKQNFIRSSTAIFSYHSHPDPCTTSIQCGIFSHFCFKSCFCEFELFGTWEYSGISHSAITTFCRFSLLSHTPWKISYCAVFVVW